MVNNDKLSLFSTVVTSKVAKGARLGEGLLNGVIGDHLHSTSNGLSREMQFYKNNTPIELTSENIRVHYPEVSPKICILVHGLINDETIWNFPNQPNTNYGSIIQTEWDYTPLYLRYNTGIHISQNGKLLSHLIHKLLKVYPVEVKDIVIIGHSMGGLATRSACYYAAFQGADWTPKVSKIFFLGTPHLGAPLEKFGNAMTFLLKKIPNSYTNLTGDIINLRSAGIKDLRYGYLTDEDWQNHHPDQLLQNNKTVVPLLEHISYYLITGTLTDGTDDLINQWFGDALVRKDSAKGQSKNKHHLFFNLKNHKEITGLVHHKLVNSKEVYEQIRCWMNVKSKSKKSKITSLTQDFPAKSDNVIPSEPIHKASKLNGVSTLFIEGFKGGLCKLAELNRSRITYKILNNIPLVNIVSREIENVQVGFTEKILSKAISAVEKMNN